MSEEENQSSPNMQEIMQRAQEMQERMKKAQDRIAKITAEGVSGGGLAKVSMNGKYDVLDLAIDPMLLSEELEIVTDVIKAAFVDAKRKVEALVKEEMAVVARDMGLPT